MTCPHGFDKAINCRTCRKLVDRMASETTIWSMLLGHKHPKRPRKETRPWCGACGAWWNGQKWITPSAVEEARRIMGELVDFVQRPAK